MWPLDGHSLVTSRRTGRAVLIAAVTLGMAVLHTCHAFLTSSSPGRVGELRLNPSRLSTEIPVPEPTVASDMAVHSSDSSWKIVSGLALLIGAAARCMSRSPKAQRMRKYQKFSVVSCKALSAGTLQAHSHKQVSACNSLLDIGVSMSDQWENSMMQVPYIPVGARAEVCSGIQSGSLHMSSEVPVLPADTFCGNLPGHRSTAGCARRAGKARCSSRGHRAHTSRSATRAARRNVGARLKGVQHVEAQRMAYDPSCVRTKLQVGLQISSRTRLASSREAKTPSAMKSSTKSSGLHHIQASDLGVTMTGIMLEQKHSQQSLLWYSLCFIALGVPLHAARSLGPC